MDAVYSCDEKFADKAAISITSLFENNILIKNIRVFVLGIGLDEKTVSKLKNIGEIYFITGKMTLKKDDGLVPQDFLRIVKVINFDQNDLSFKFLKDITKKDERFPAAALLRILTPQFLPQDVSRYLYLDSDTLVRRDLSMLFNEDLSGFTCGMIPEPTIYDEVRKYLKLSKSDPYFNSGVILVDKDKWIHEDISENCMEILKKEHDKLEFIDQDALNLALKGKVKALSPAFNFFSNYHYRSFKSLTKVSAWYGQCTDRNEYEAAKRNPAIVHFAGLERPWFKGNFNPYEREYEKYLALSPFKDTEKIKGHEKEMFLYHIMNLLTKVSPSLRNKISKAYYRAHKK